MTDLTIPVLGATMNAAATLTKYLRGSTSTSSSDSLRSLTSNLDNESASVPRRALQMMLSTDSFLFLGVIGILIVTLVLGALIIMHRNMHAEEHKKKREEEMKGLPKFQGGGHIDEAMNHADDRIKEQKKKEIMDKLNEHGIDHEE